MVQVENMSANTFIWIDWLKQAMYLESMLTACEVLHPSTTASTLQVGKYLQFLLFQPEGLKMFILQKEVSTVIDSAILLRNAFTCSNALQWVQPPFHCCH